MILTKKHFDVLASIVGSKSTPTQKSIAETTGYSLETIEKTNKELLDMGFIVDGEMTQKGISYSSRGTEFDAFLYAQHTKTGV